MLQVVGYLNAKFACGRQNECLNVLLRSVDFGQQGQPECCGFAGAGLRQGYQIALLIQQEWNHLFLNRHGRFVAEFGYSRQDFGTKSQIFKFCHVVLCYTLQSIGSKILVSCQYWRVKTLRKQARGREEFNQENTSKRWFVNRVQRYEKK